MVALIYALRDYSVCVSFGVLPASRNVYGRTEGRADAFWYQPFIVLHTFYCLAYTRRYHHQYYYCYYYYYYYFVRSNNFFFRLLSLLQLRFYLFSSLHFVPHRKWTFIFDYICQFSKLYYLINQPANPANIPPAPRPASIHASFLISVSLYHMLSPCAVSHSRSPSLWICARVCADCYNIYK